MGALLALWLGGIPVKHFALATMSLCLLLGGCDDAPGVGEPDTASTDPTMDAGPGGRETIDGRTADSVDLCEADSCGPFGSCVTLEGAPTCLCEPGYAGHRCTECSALYEKAADGTCVFGAECRAEKCGARGECTADDEGVIGCACDEGFAGDRCAECAEGYRDDGQGCVPVEVCTADRCSGHGVCDERTGVTTCSCDRGWGGEDCSETCAGNTCSGAGVCQLDETGAWCACDDPDLTIESDCADCAAGLVRVVDATGAVRCEPPATCGAGSCEHGACSPVGAGCECESGWTGDACQRCAEGFVRSGDRCVREASCGDEICSAAGSCQIERGQVVGCDCDAGRIGESCGESLPVAGYVLTGHERALEPGESTTLTAEALGVGRHAELVWELVEGEGTLEIVADGSVVYTAPRTAPELLEMATVRIHPLGSPDQAVEIALAYQAPSMPGVTGTSNPLFATVDEKLMQFMYDRCTGAVVLGLNWQGVPMYRRGYGRTSGPASAGRATAESCGDIDPDAEPVWPGTPMRIGSNSKAVTAAIVRSYVFLALYLADRLPKYDDFDGYADWRRAADAAVENVRITDDELGLLPPEMLEVTGTCSWDPNAAVYLCTNGTVTPPLGGAPTSVFGLFADPSWTQVTVGQLFDHKSGLPPGAVGHSTVRDGLFALRSFHDPSFDSVDDVGPLVNGTDRFLERRPSSYEYILAQLSQPFASTPGTAESYSNLGFTLLGVIAEYMSGHPDWAYGNAYAGHLQHNSGHLHSALDEFVRARLGGWPGDDNVWGATLSRFGMFLARTPNPMTPPGSQIDPYEVRPRDWTGSGWSPDRADLKGLICVPDGMGGCDTFSTGVVDGFGNPDPMVGYGYHGSLAFAASGALVTESETYLRFMQKFHVGEGSGSGGYGRRRLGWNVGDEHNGLWGGAGAIAFVRQIGWQVGDERCNATKDADGTCTGDACCSGTRECVSRFGLGQPVSDDPSENVCAETTQYRVPGVVALTGDYTTRTPESCVLPAGLDIFVAANQSTDPNDFVGKDYDLLIDAVLEGLCQVEWPTSPIEVQPGVILAP